MSESYEHRQLVEKSAEWVVKNLLDDESVYLTVDLDHRIDYQGRVVVLNNYRPDLFAYNPKTELLVIGEAKTAKDIDRDHSISQYKSYFETCKLNRGVSYIVFAIPFTMKPRMLNVLRNTRIFSEDKVHIVILEY